MPRTSGLSGGRYGTAGTRSIDERSAGGLRAINLREVEMQAAQAIDRAVRRHCLLGQFRFTEWAMQEVPEEQGRAALAAVEREGIEVKSIHSRNGIVWAKLRQGAVPWEILSWFAHFEKKGIPAGIVKNRVTGEYAVFRDGVDLNEDEEDGEPEVFSKPDIMLLRRCHGFSLRLVEY